MAAVQTDHPGVRVEQFGDVSAANEVAAQDAKDGKKSEFNSPANVEALQFMVDGIKNGDSAIYKIKRDAAGMNGNIVSEKRGETKRGICFFPRDAVEVTDIIEEADKTSLEGSLRRAPLPLRVLEQGRPVRVVDNELPGTVRLTAENLGSGSLGA